MKPTAAFLINQKQNSSMYHPGNDNLRFRKPVLVGGANEDLSRQLLQKDPVFIYKVYSIGRLEMKSFHLTKIT